MTYISDEVRTTLRRIREIAGHRTDSNIGPNVNDYAAILEKAWVDIHEYHTEQVDTLYDVISTLEARLAEYEEAEGELDAVNEELAIIAQEAREQDDFRFEFTTTPEENTEHVRTQED